MIEGQRLLEIEDREAGEDRQRYDLLDGFELAAVYAAEPQRLAGTARQYSKKAMPQLDQNGEEQRRGLVFRCPYQAKVMKMLERVRSTIGAIQRSKVPAAASYASMAGRQRYGGRHRPPAAVCPCPLTRRGSRLDTHTQTVLIGAATARPAPATPRGRPAAGGVGRITVGQNEGLARTARQAPRRRGRGRRSVVCRALSSNFRETLCRRAAYLAQ